MISSSIEIKRLNKVCRIKGTPPLSITKWTILPKKQQLKDKIYPLSCKKDFSVVKKTSMDSWDIEFSS